MRTLLPRIAVVLSYAACGPAPVPEVPPPPRPPPPAAPTVVSPARWLERHPELLEPTASRKLPGGGTIHGGEHGERWVTPAPPAGDAGAPAVETAPSLLPEQILAIAPSNGRWAFFGASGRAFLAATPLGAIEEVRPAPAAIRSFSAGSAAILAVTRAGELLRSTDGGASFRPLAVPALATAVPDELAMGPEGVGALLALPQRAIATADDGASWAPVALPMAHPAGGAHRVQVSEEGEVWLASSTWRPTRSHVLQSRPLRFVPREDDTRSRRSPAREDDDTAGDEDELDTRRAVGKRFMLAVGHRNGRWKVQVSEWDREGAWRARPELEGCLPGFAAAAVWDDELVAGCARREERDEGARTRELRLALYRSRDGGASWTQDDDASLWHADGLILAGPEGLLLVRRDCPEKAQDCAEYLLRPAAGKPFVLLPTAPEAVYSKWAIDPPRRRVVALSRGGSPGAARVHVWDFEGQRGKATELFPTDSDFAGDLTVDEQGGIVVVASAPDRAAVTRPGERAPEVWRVFRSTDDGATFAATPGTLGAGPARLGAVALAGDRGIAVDMGDEAEPGRSGPSVGDDEEPWPRRRSRRRSPLVVRQLWETADAARTWVPVTSHPFRGDRIQCSREGCQLGVELRHGWDLSSRTSPPPLAAALVEPPPKVPGGSPLRCAMGEEREIAGALVDDLDKLAIPPRAGGDLVVPVADAGLGLDLAVLGAAAGKVTITPNPVFPAAPNRATVGSHTDVILDSAGVLASRSTYPVDRSGASFWISPVTMELAWWRPKDGKVFHGRLPPLGKGDMRGTFRMGERHWANEVFSLTADAAYYRPWVHRAEHLFTFTDTGAPSRMKVSSSPGAVAALRTASGLTLLSTGGYLGPSWVLFAPADDKEGTPFTLWALAPRSDAPTIFPMQRAAGGAALVAWSDPDGPAHGFLVPLEPGEAPAEVVDLRLASLLVARPRACEALVDPASIRVRLPLPRAARHVLLLEGGARPALAAAEAAIVVVPPQGEPCVSEWIGHREGEKGSSLLIVPVADPRRSWSISAGPTEANDGLRARKLHVRPLRCEEAQGLAIPASLGWNGF